jgi:hypothetical protein
VKRIDRAAKRALDLATAVPMLFLAATALLLMSLAVRAEDGAPAGATTCAHTTTGIFSRIDLVGRARRGRCARKTRQEEPVTPPQRALPILPNEGPGAPLELHEPGCVARPVLGYCFRLVVTETNVR